MTNDEYFKCGWPFYKINPLPSTNIEKTNELLLVAECVSGVYLNFYKDFIQDKNSDLICPKLDNKSQCLQKLAKLIEDIPLERIVIIRMEYKCCGYLTELIKDALKTLNKNIPLTEKIVNKKGKVAEIKKKS